MAFYENEQFLIKSDQIFFKPFLNMHTFTKLNKEENISRQAEHQRGIESVNIQEE